MTRDGRLGRLEGLLGPGDPPFEVRHCSAPAGLSPAAHDAWHAAEGAYCFSMNLCQAEANR